MPELVGFQPTESGSSSQGKPLEGFEPIGRPDFLDDKYSRSTLDATKEVGRQLAGGIVSDLPKMVGQGIQWMGGQPSSAANEYGKGVAERAEARGEDYEPHNAGSGFVGRTLSMGARAVGPMIPTLAAAAIPGVGEIAGPAMAGLSFGTSSAQETKDKLMKQGVGDSESTQAGYLSGLAQGGGEVVGAHFLTGMFRAGKAAFGAAGPTMDGIVDHLTSTAVLKPVAKTIGINMLVEPTTNVAQDLATEAVERAYGAKPEDMWEMTKNSAQGAVGLTALLGPFAAGARMGHARRAAAFEAALNNPFAPPAIRAQAEQIAIQQAEQAGVPSDQIMQWQADRAALASQRAVVPPAGGANVLAGEGPTTVEEKKVEAAAPKGPMEGFQPDAPTPPQQAAQVAQVAPPAQGQQAVVSPNVQGASVGVAPEVKAQQEQQAVQQTQVAQQQAAEQAQQQVEVDKIKKDIEARKSAVAEATTILNGGDATIKVPTRYSDLMADLKALNDNGKVGEEMYQKQKNTLIAALQTNDNKTLQTVRKTVESFTKPKVETKVTATEPDKKTPAPTEKVAEKPAEAVTPVAPVITPAPVVKPGMRKAPKPGAVEVIAKTPKPEVALPAQPAKKFDNLPDLADAVAKENGLPQAVSDMWMQHTILGRSQTDVGKDLGMGKQRVQEILAQFSPMVKDAALTRYDRSGETVEPIHKEAPGEVVDDVTNAPSGEEAVAPPMEEGKIDDNAPAAGTGEERAGADTSEALHGEFAGSGDLVDEDNHNGYDDATDRNDGNINIVGESGKNGKGKVSADKNVGKDRSATLEKRWDQFSARLPEKQRVAWGDLGSAQQDTFDAVQSKSENQQRKAHEAISQSAHEGAKYLVTKDESIPLSATDHQSKLGTVPPVSNAALASLEVPGIKRQTVPFDLVVDGDHLTLHPVRPGKNSSVLSAVHELLTHSQAGAFFKLGMDRIKRIGTYTIDPKSSGVSGLLQAEAFYDSQRNMVAINAAGAVLRVQSDRGEQHYVASAMAHETVHAIDYYAGNDSFLSTDGDSKTFVFAEMYDYTGPPPPGALPTWSGGEERLRLRLSDNHPMMLEIGSYIIDEMRKSTKMKGNPLRLLTYIFDDLFSLRAEVNAMPADERGMALITMGQDIARAEHHAQVETFPVLTQLYLEYPDLLKSALPQSYAAVEQLVNAKTLDEVRSAILKETTNVPATARQAGLAVQGPASNSANGAGREGGQASERVARAPGTADHGEVGHVGETAGQAGRAEGPVGEAVEGAPPVSPEVRVPAQDDAGRRADGNVHSEAATRDSNERPVGDSAHVAENGASANGLSGLGGKGNPPAPPLKPGGAKEFAKSLFTEKIYRTFPSLLGALSTEQLGDRFKEHPLVQKFAEAAQRMGGMANKIMGEANHSIQDWQRAARTFGKAKDDAFGKLLLDATTEGMWPNRDFEDASHDYLKPAPLTAQASAADIARREAELAPLAAKHAALKKAFEAMPDAYKNLFAQIEATNRNNFDRHVDADRKSIVESYYASLGDKVAPPRDVIDAAAKVEPRGRTEFKKQFKDDPATLQRLNDLWDSLDAHKGDYENKLAGPYFPKSRFGDHIVNYKSPEFTKAEAALEAAKAKLVDAKTGVGQDERAEVDADVRAIERKLKRATTQETIDRHTSDLADAKARQEELTKEIDSAKADVAAASKTLNEYKADATHYNVEFYENRALAQQRLKQLNEFFGNDGMKAEYALRDQFLTKQDGTTPAYMNRIADHLVGSLTGVEAEDVRRTVREMHILNLPGSSALKHQLKRRNVPGVREDQALRSFSAKAVKDAYAISRKSFAGEMHDAVSTLRYGDNTNEDAKLLGNELAHRIALNTGLKVNKALALATQTSYFMQLGMSPGFMLMQATQQWINTAPMMAARHGVGTATKEIAKGTADAAKMLKISFSANGSKMHFDLDLKKAVDAKIITPRESVMLQEMLDRGRIDVASAHDAGIAATGRDRNIVGRAAQMSNWPVQQLEVINRISTALAGFRAESSKQTKDGVETSKGEDAATKYADQLVSETHMNYASENRARFIHPNSWGGWGRVMFQFRAYQQGMAYLTAKNILDGLRGNKEALRAGAYMTAVQIGTAGLAGMPLPGAMAVVATLLYHGFTDDDDERDIKEMFYQGLKSVGGDTFATAITKGLPAALGVDVSEKLGAGHTFDVAPFVRDQKDGRDMTAAYFMSIFGGPAGGQVANYAEAMRLAANGDFVKASTLMLPKAVGDVVKAEEYQRVGLKDSRGNTILDPSEISAADTAIRALGLTPSDIGRTQDARKAFFDARQNRKDARSKLLASFARAKLAGEDVSDINAEIEGFNERNPEVKINQGSKATAVSKHVADLKNIHNGVPVRKNERQLYADVLGED